MHKPASVSVRKTLSLTKHHGSPKPNTTVWVIRSQNQPVFADGFPITRTKKSSLLLTHHADDIDAIVALPFVAKEVPLFLHIA